MSELDDIITQTFIQEAKERVQSLNNGLLELEKNGHDTKILDEIFRDAHTLKGSARMVGIESIGAIAHKMEDLLGLIKNSTLKLKEELLNLLFSGLDSIQVLVDEIESSKPESIDIENICAAFDSYNEKDSKNEEPSRNRKKPKEPEVKESSEVIFKDEDIIEPDRKEDHKPITFNRNIKKPVNSSFRKIDDTVRVSSQNLDNLVNLVGELVISESGTEHQEKMLNESLLLARKARALLATRSFIEKEDEFENERVNLAFMELNRTLSVVFSEFKKERTVRDIIIQKLQDQVLDLRLLPVSVVFDAYPRMVRDLASKAKKDIRLVLKGTGTKLDKKVLEQIKDPLIHIIRNSIDHGLENPVDREKFGKNAQGEIILAAYQEGENVVIEVSDNGKGIDYQKVKRKVLENKLISEKDSVDFKDEDWLTFIFEPGFTTKEKVDEVSGRGVGLDVARRNVEELKGTIKVSTTTGKGTKLTMRLPLTLAVSRALLVDISGQKFAIPSTTISETNIINSQVIQTIESKETYKLREKTVGIIDVAKTLGISNLNETGHRKRHLVCLSGYDLVALGVDKFYGEVEIIVKNAGIHLNNLPSLAGVTIIEGELVPILRASYIINVYQQGLGFAAADNLGNETAMNDDKTILIVEDSLTTREMEKSMLESAGFSVDEAVDGVEGLEKIRRKRYGLIVVDVEMPRMNGLELVRSLRKEKIFQSLPIIIVSSLGSDEDRAKGLEVGADYYMTKSDLLKKDFIEVVREFIN